MELHVVFNYSAVETVRRVLAGHNATAARFSDNLSYGPISQFNSGIRRAWVETQLKFDNPDISVDDEIFWPQVLSKDVSRVAWVSRRNAAEYCGFLNYLQRLGDLPTRVVDTTDARCGEGQLFRGTGSIPAGDMVLQNFPGVARELDAKSRASHLDCWAMLQSENADLRVVDKDLALFSAPVTF